MILGNKNKLTYNQTYRNKKHFAMQTNKIIIKMRIKKRRNKRINI